MANGTEMQCQLCRVRRQQLPAGLPTAVAVGVGLTTLVAEGRMGIRKQWAIVIVSIAVDGKREG